jgi:uncharacterized membrane-anchored protein
MNHPHPETYCALPDDTPLRMTLQDEVHARPAARIRMPALVVCVAVLNAGISREQELAHLRELTGQQDLTLDVLRNNFLRLRLNACTLKWERHTEFTRYSLVQSLPIEAHPSLLTAASKLQLPQSLTLPSDWLRRIPGQTIAAIMLTMVESELSRPELLLAQSQAWLDGGTVLVSQIGLAKSWVATQLRVGADGFEHMLVMSPPGTTEARTGRISTRLIEMEIYRLMALQGLPVAKALGGFLSDCEKKLVEITTEMASKSASDEHLLDSLVSLAAKVEQATAAHSYRFSATGAYSALVNQRITELHEQPAVGIELIGHYLQHRLSPAIATVAATERRLQELSERIFRTSALLRTRVDIATEQQSRQLLEKLTRGQELQLRLQATVEGLSIAAISYYVVSLLLYIGKAAKGMGLPINPEIAAGLSIPLVVWLVWRGTQHVRHAIQPPSK